MTQQTEAQRLAAAIESRTTTYGECREAAALLLRQDELLGRALEALEMLFPFEINVKQQDAFAAIRAHREAK